MKRWCLKFHQSSTVPNLIYGKQPSTVALGACSMGRELSQATIHKDRNWTLFPDLSSLKYGQD